MGMQAVYNNHNSVVELLLKTANIDVKLKDDRGYPHRSRCALRLALEKNNSEALKLLINVPNFDVNEVVSDGHLSGDETALHLAAKLSGNIEALKVLLNVSNIDVNIVNKFGQTALHLAVEENNIEALKLLLSHPSLTALTLNQNDKDEGDTPVMLAVKYDRLDHLAVLTADPRVDLKYSDYSSTIFLVDFCKKGDLEGVKDALQRGADVNKKGAHGWTALMWAVRNNHKSVVELLVKAPNIDVNLKDDLGRCALHQALGKNWRKVTNDKYGAFKPLLNVPNIDVNSVDNNGYTPLHTVVEANNIRDLMVLLNVPSIDVNSVTDSGWTVFHLAVIGNEIEIEGLKLLLTHPSLTAQTLNKKTKFQGDTPVMYAAKLKKLEHLAVLAADPRVDLDTTDRGS